MPFEIMPLIPPVPVNVISEAAKLSREETALLSAAYATGKVSSQKLTDIANQIIKAQPEAKTVVAKASVSTIISPRKTYLDVLKPPAPIIPAPKPTPVVTPPPTPTPVVTPLVPAPTPTVPTAPAIGIGTLVVLGILAYMFLKKK